MICTNCQTQIIAGSNYCDMCGVAIAKAKVTGVLDRLCANCGVAMLPNAKFCSNCGPQVSQSAFAHTIRYSNPEQVEQLYKAANNS